MEVTSHMPPSAVTLQACLGSVESQLVMSSVDQAAAETKKGQKKFRICCKSDAVNLSDFLNLLSLPMWKRYTRHINCKFHSLYDCCYIMLQTYT